MKNKKENKSAEAAGNKASEEEKRLEKKRKSEFITKLSLIFTILGTFTTFIENELVKFWLKIIFFIILSYTILNLFFFEGYKNIKNMVNRFLQKPLFKKILFVLVIIISIAIMLVLVNFINRFFEKDKIGKHFDLLKLMNENNLIQSENHLNNFSNESIDVKIGVLEKILSKCDENDRESFKIEIMPIVYHAMIGLKKKNYKDILDFALKHLNEKNKGKVSFLLKKQYFDFVFRGELIKKFQKLLDDKYPLDQSKNVWFHEFVVTALMEIGNGNKDSHKILEGIIEKSKNSTLLKYTVQALNQIEGKKAIEILIKLFIKNESDKVRESVSEAINELGNASFDELECLLEKSKETNCQKYLIAAIGKTDSNHVIKKLNDIINSSINLDNKRAAIEAIGKIGTQEAINYLIKYLKNKDQNLNRFAAIAITLGKKTNYSAKESLIELIESNLRKKDIVALGIEALGNLKYENHPPPIKFIEDFLNRDKQQDVLLKTLEALRNLNDVDAVSDIVSILNSEKQIPVLEKSVEVLGDMGDSNTTEVIINFMKTDLASKIKTEIFENALGNLAPKSIDIMIEYLKNNKGNSKIKQCIIGALGNDKIRKVIVKNSKVIDELMNLFEESVYRDFKIIEALGKIIDENTVERLKEILKSGACNCSKYIISIALGERGNSANNAIQTLRDLFDDEKVDYFRRYIFLHSILSIDPLDGGNNDIFEESIKNPFFQSGGKIFNEKFKEMLNNCKSLNSDTETYFPKSFISEDESIASDMIGLIEKIETNRTKNEIDGNFWKMLEWWENTKKENDKSYKK